MIVHIYVYAIPELYPSVLRRREIDKYYYAN